MYKDVMCVAVPRYVRYDFSILSYNYGTARFKLDTRECSTRVCFVTRSEYFCEISRVYNYCTRNCRA